MKKGVLFSLITLIFMILLSTFSGLLVKESSFNTQIYVNSHYAEKNIEDEIGFNTLDIMHVRLSTISENSVNFANFSDLNNYAMLLQNYENYLNNEYPDIVNQEISVTLEPAINIYPYTTNLEFGNIINVSTNNVDSFSMNIKMNDTFGTFSEPNDDGIGIEVSIKLYDQTNTLVNDTTITLNPNDTTGNNFIWENAGNQTVVSLNNNTLQISSDSSANIYNFTINYDYDSNIRIYTGDLTLKHKSGKIEI